MEIEVILIIAGVIGLLFEFACSLRKANAEFNKYIESQRNTPKIIRYDREGWKL